MTKSSFALFVLGCLAYPVTSSLTFDQWAGKFHKTYDSAEAEATAKINFEASRIRVGEQNELFDSGASTWKAGLNRLSDMTPDDFISTYTMPLMSDGQNCSATKKTELPMEQALRTGPTPDAIDWRDVGAVTEVKDQGNCGSCWTFSTTGCLESHHFLMNGLNADGTMTLLAEQQLVDCAQAFRNMGCSGGLPSQAFEYVMYNNGLDTEGSYPYTAQDGNCSYNPDAVGASVSAVHNITYLDEDQLVDAVGQFGPVSIAFQVASDFKDYESGVYTSTVCESSPDQVNHAVLAVGYDKTMSSETLPYYIVKNSWGTDWGIDGYFWIEMGKNMCGLADCASFPTATKL